MLGARPWILPGAVWELTCGSRPRFHRGGPQSLKIASSATRAVLLGVDCRGGVSRRWFVPAPSRLVGESAGAPKVPESPEEAAHSTRHARALLAHDTNARPRPCSLWIASSEVEWYSQSHKTDPIRPPEQLLHKP